MLATDSRVSRWQAMRRHSRRSGRRWKKRSGVHFEGEKGEHFFHSTLVQTLFYGVFSAWVLWSRSTKVEVPSISV